MCYHAVGVTSNNHSIRGRKLLVSSDTTDAENDAPQVAPTIPYDLQVEFLAKFRLNQVICVLTLLDPVTSKF